LQRQENASQATVGKWACSWWLRIIDFSMDHPGVQYLKPHVIIATQTGEGIFKTTCAESLGKRICRDFNLKIDEVLWIEHYLCTSQSLNPSLILELKYFIISTGGPLCPMSSKPLNLIYQDPKISNVHSTSTP